MYELKNFHGQICIIMHWTIMDLYESFKVNSATVLNEHKFYKNFHAIIGIFYLEQII